MKTIYELELHEKEYLQNKNAREIDMVILRVPGGWIYNLRLFIDGQGHSYHSTFVPFHNEFQKKVRPKATPKPFNP